MSKIIHYSSKEKHLINEMKLHIPGTYLHSIRVQRLTEKMLAELLQLGVVDFSETEHDAICKGAMMHDIGKLFVKRAVLTKRAALSHDEMKHVATHTHLGYEAIKKELTEDENEIIKNICLYHHERIDGSGYEHKQELPLYVHIVSVCDVFDALNSDRSYHKGLPKKKCIEIIQNGEDRSGKFDERLVAVLEKVVEDIA